MEQSLRDYVSGVVCYFLFGITKEWRGTRERERENEVGGTCHIKELPSVM